MHLLLPVLSVGLMLYNNGFGDSKSSFLFGLNNFRTYKMILADLKVGYQMFLTDLE